jgi:hypothetical protein
MYPNFNAEYARKGFTLEKLAEELAARDCKRTIATLSLKLNGKNDITLNEAKVLRDIVAPEIPIDVLFSDVAVTL